jgi:hypothetical protein
MLVTFCCDNEEHVSVVRQFLKANQGSFNFALPPNSDKADAAAAHRRRIWRHELRRRWRQEKLEGAICAL